MSAEELPQGGDSPEREIHSQETDLPVAEEEPVPETAPQPDAHEDRAMAQRQLDAVQSAARIANNLEIEIIRLAGVISALERTPAESLSPGSSEIFSTAQRQRTDMLLALIEARENEEKALEAVIGSEHVGRMYTKESLGSYRSGVVAVQEKIAKLRKRLAAPAERLQTITPSDYQKTLPELERELISKENAAAKARANARKKHGGSMMFGKSYIEYEQDAAKLDKQAETIKNQIEAARARLREAGAEVPEATSKPEKPERGSWLNGITAFFRKLVETDERKRLEKERRKAQETGELQRLHEQKAMPEPEIHIPGGVLAERVPVDVTYADMNSLSVDTAGSVLDQGASLPRLEKNAELQEPVRNLMDIISDLVSKQTLVQISSSDSKLFKQVWDYMNTLKEAEYARSERGTPFSDLAKTVREAASGKPMARQKIEDLPIVRDIVEKAKKASDAKKIKVQAFFSKALTNCVLPDLIKAQAAYEKIREEGKEKLYFEGFTFEYPEGYKISRDTETKGLDAEFNRSFEIAISTEVRDAALGVDTKKAGAQQALAQRLTPVFDLSKFGSKTTKQTDTLIRNIVWNTLNERKRDKNPDKQKRVSGPFIISLEQKKLLEKVARSYGMPPTEPKIVKEIEKQPKVPAAERHL